MFTVLDNQECIRLLASEAGEGLIETIARQLWCLYYEAMDMDDYRGWARLGAMKAAKLFDPDKFVGDTIDAKRRMCAYLIKKGRNLAIDYMRDAKAVGHVRHGLLAERPIQAASMSALDRRGDGAYLVIDQDAGVDPAQVAELHDLMDTITDKLEGEAKRVFVMLYVEGIPTDEIAAKLDIPRHRVYYIQTHYLMPQITEFVQGKRTVFCQLREKPRKM